MISTKSFSGQKERKLVFFFTLSLLFKLLLELSGQPNAACAKD